MITSRGESMLCRWEARGRVVLDATDPRPRIMGILNLTPDSFSDGGRFGTAQTAVAEALQLLRDGADIIDLGGESTRPGSLPVSTDEECKRVFPVIEQLAAASHIPLSIDTTKALVAEGALARGASIVNDVTALAGDPEMADVVASSGAGVVLMHMQGTPATMQLSPRYSDVVSEILEFLEERIEWCATRGIPRCRIAIDPGIGFGKSHGHNLELLRNLRRFANLACVVVGTSRKGFLGALTGQEVGNRAVASVASALAALDLGARVVRMHDVRDMADALAVWGAQHGWESQS